MIFLCDIFDILYWTDIVRTPTRNQVGQNLFWKNRVWVGRDGGQKPGGTSSIWEGHKFVGGAFPFLGTKIFLLVQFFFR